MVNFADAAAIIYILINQILLKLSCFSENSPFYISIALIAALLIRLRFFLIFLLGRAGGLGFAGGGGGRMVVDVVAVTKGYKKVTKKFDIFLVS